VAYRAKILKQTSGNPGFVLIRRFSGRQSRQRLIRLVPKAGLTRPTDFSRYIAPDFLQYLGERPEMSSQ
jgi:hypothetical protein